MNLNKVNDLLNKIDLLTKQVEGQDNELSEYTENIRTCVEAIRAEVNPPADAEVAPGRRAISFNKGLT